MTKKHALPLSFDTVWQAVVTAAKTADLDPTKFRDPHRALLNDILTFINHPPTQSTNQPPTQSTNWFRRIGFRQRRLDPPPEPHLAPPIILIGEPGTGKTTFLYLLDLVLRQELSLPDNVQPTMVKGNGRSHLVPKRQFNRQPISLLSVRQWSELLHFYAWDIEQHRFIPNAQESFIRQTLRPMRILFADEVEMTGYSPTLPDLAQEGLLVVGTSNQTRFPQLETHELPPKIYDFSGLDMRSGSPADAIAQPDEAAWSLFDTAQQQPERQQEMLKYHPLFRDEAIFVWFDFRTAVSAPLLETDWLNLFNNLCQEAGNPQAELILLLEQFSLEWLRSDYNAIIRFVSLFDAIEQIGAGVLVRNLATPPALSREALKHMKVTILMARGVTEVIKQRVTVGIDRATSRIGQAGHHAQTLLQRPAS